jgi:hypothetical protein
MIGEAASCPTVCVDHISGSGRLKSLLTVLVPPILKILHHLRRARLRNFKS